MWAMRRLNITAQYEAEALTRLLWKMLLALAAYFLSIDVVYAAPGVTVGGVTGPGFTLLDPLVTAAEEQGNESRNILAAIGENTFFILATLELAWAAALWAIEKDNMSSFTVDLIQKMMFITFFFMLLDQGPELIPIIVRSFEVAGERATGAPPLTVDSIIATGLAVINFIWSKAPKDIPGILGKFGQILVAVLVTIVVAVAYFIAAAQLLCLRLEAFILLAAGAIFLAFGGSNWTNEYVTKYFKYALTVGVRLLAILLILGLTTGFINRIGANFTFDFLPLFQILAMSVMTAVLAVQAPEMASALMSGGIGFSGGSFVSSARSIKSGLSTAGAIAGAPVKAGAAVGKAGYHAFKLAQNSKKLATATGGSAAGIFAKSAGAQLGRGAMNFMRGKDGSTGFKAGGKDVANQAGKNAMGTGSSSKPGALDRANRDVKAKLEAANSKKGGSVEGS